jgi:hypothetical protein
MCFWRSNTMFRYKLVGVVVAMASLPLLSLVAVAERPIIAYHPPDPRILAGTSSSLDYYGNSPGYISADAFFIYDATAILDIEWWGLHDPPSSNLDDFVFTIYRNKNGFLPGDVIRQATGSVFSQQVPEIDGLTAYSVRLDSPILLDEGLSYYWLSIYNANEGASWRWNNSLSGTNSKVRSLSPPGDDWVRVPGNATNGSFILIAVPEPSTWVIIGVLVSISVLFRYRSCTKLT